MIELPTPYLLFLGDVTNPLDAKTAMGLRDWRPEQCIGQCRLPDSTVDLGLAEMTVEAAAAAGAKSIVIGVAPSGGALKPAWVQVLKAALEAQGITMSLADIIQLAGAVAVEATGGPRFRVRMGRVDATRADSFSPGLPGTSDSAEQLIGLFGGMGFNTRDLVALTGAHTLGTTASSTSTRFDNSHFRDIIARRGGLLPSDTVLMNNAQTRAIVEEFAENQGAFFRAFADAMVKNSELGM